MTNKGILVAFVQEYRSEKSLEALNKLVPHYCHLVRYVYYNLLLYYSAYACMLISYIEMGKSTRCLQMNWCLAILCGSVPGIGFQRIVDWYQ